MSLCFLATLVPITIFHHHQENLQCDETNLILEANSCHVSVYHEQSDVTSCKHTTHISKESDTCTFCKVITPRRFQYDIFDDYNPEFIPRALNPNDLIGESCLKLFILSNVKLGRAPPF